MKEVIKKVSTDFSAYTTLWRELDRMNVVFG